MEYSKFTQIYTDCILRDESVLPGGYAERNRPRALEPYSIVGPNLLKRGKIVLHENNARERIQSIHDVEDHCNRADLQQKAALTYDCVGLRDLCRRIVRECRWCNRAVLESRIESPLIHPTKKRLDFICKKLGIPIPQNRPLMKYMKE